MLVERVDLIYTMMGETDTRKATYAIPVACRAWSKSHERCHVRLARAASSHHPARLQSTLTKTNKSINAHNFIVFYSCNRSMHRHGSDTTDGFVAWKTKKFYREHGKNQDPI